MIGNRNKYFARLLIKILPLGILLCSCAQIVNPSGGEKDTAPPKISKSVPANYSPNFLGKSVEITFDEYVQIKDLNNQLIISPPLKNVPDYKIKGKTVLVSWGDTLENNTTYTFNFGSAISDVNEGNILDSNLFVFSTGSLIDSLKLSGTVKNVLDSKPEKGVYVMLYKNWDDSVPLKQRPDYVTRTRENGNYMLSNIKHGTYKMFALKDKNQDFIYNQPGELIAFADSVIVMDTIRTKNLVLFEEEIQKLFVKKAFVEQYGKVSIILNKPSDEIFFEPLRKSQNTTGIIIEKSMAKDSILLWITGEMPDSLSFVITDKKDFTDTLEFDLPKEVIDTDQKNKRGQKPLKLVVSNNVNADLLDINQPLRLAFNHPVIDYNFRKIYLTSLGDSLSFSTMFQDKSLRRFQIQYPFKQDSMYHLFVPPGVFTDIFGKSNDTLDVKFSLQKQDFYGTLLLKISNSEISVPYIVELLDDKKNVIKKMMSSNLSELKFNSLKPGQYSLKLIFDSNNNGKWDTGKYLIRNQPEQIIYYPAPVTIRSNWDLEIEWKLN